MALRKRVDERGEHGPDRRRVLPQVLAPPLHGSPKPGSQRDQEVGGRTHELRGPGHELFDQQHDWEGPHQGVDVIKLFVFVTDSAAK